MTARSKRQSGPSPAGGAIGGAGVPSVKVKKKKQKKKSRGK